MEIAARDGAGFPDKLIRDVGENARTLEFETFGFEERQPVPRGGG